MPEENKALTMLEEQNSVPMVMPTSTEQFFGLVQTMLTNKDIDPAKMHAMIDVMERLKNKEAETAFNVSYMKVKLSLPRFEKLKPVEYDIDKTDPSKGKKTAFLYTSYEELDKVLRQLERNHGFARSFTSVEKAGGGIVVTCTLRHEQGHSIESAIPVALDTSGGKNNIQAMGSSFSYGKRYTTTMVWDIVTVGEDDDGEGAHPLVTEEQVQRLKDSIKFVGSIDEKLFLQYMGVDSLENIKEKDFNKANMAIKSKVEGTPVKKK